MELAGGSYGAQTIDADPAKTVSTDVTFRAAPNATATFGSTEIYGSHITFQGPGLLFGTPAAPSDGWRTWDGVDDVTFRNVTGDKLAIYGSKDVSVIGGSYGPSHNEYSFISSPCPGCRVPTNILLDGVYFHDYTRDAGEHTECLHAVSVQNLTIRNSRFQRCAIMDLFLTINANSTQPFRNLVLENNRFHAQVGGYYEVFLDQRVSFEGALIRNNSIEGVLILEPTFHGSNVRVIGNIGELRPHFCNASVTYSHNVWFDPDGNPAVCGADKGITAANPGWSTDLRLTSGSPAIGAADSANFPPFDFEGDPRPQGSAPDAGADEVS